VWTLNVINWRRLSVYVDNNILDLTQTDNDNDEDIRHRQPTALVMPEFSETASFAGRITLSYEINNYKTNYPGLAK